MKLTLCFVALLTMNAFAFSQDFRPPAVPLVVHDPYFSVWSPADRLSDAWPVHWTGRRHALQSMARIDGRAYRLMGPEPQGVEPLSQKSLTVHPTRTIYVFATDAVRVTLTFTTPALPDDLEILSRPVTYIEWEAQALDGKPHAVAVYFDCAGELAVNAPEQPLVWAREAIPGLAALRMGSQEQPILQKKGDDLRIDWGYVYLAAPSDAGAPAAPQMGVGRAEQMRGAFIKDGALPAANKDELSQPRAANDGWPVMACVLNLGELKEKPVARHVLLAYDDIWSIQYMADRLRPYWRRNGVEARDLLQAAARDYATLAARCKAFDEELTADLTRAGGEQYAQIAALAYRQCLGGNKLAADAHGRPLLFPKENFSNGCVATVDVIYPMAPLFLLLGPDLSKAMLVPVLDYGSSPRWKFPFAPHDLGTYPHATGQVYGGGERTEENQMPVEESANLIILVAAVAKMEGKPDFAVRYWPVLAKWAEYLRSKGLDPENQLCTDDFTGHLAHNVNLSCKAVLALGAYAQLCEMRGLKEESAAWRAVAERFAAEWAKMADDGGHTRLAFDKPGTWSQKYNLVWDRVLGLNLFSDALKAREMQHYRRAQNAYGLPLDSRATFTKIDWTHWAACLTGAREDFEALSGPMRRYLHETPDRVPMCDWHETKTAKKINMIARPVVGGVFMKPLHDAKLWRKWFQRGARGPDDWAAFPLVIYEPLVPTAEQGGQQWRYITSAPTEPAGGAAWFQPDFDDSRWNTGESGFGTEGTPGAVVRTKWNTPEIWLRRAFELPADENAQAAWRKAELQIHHDEDAEVYLNGVLAARLRGYVTGYVVVPFAPEALATLKPGENTLAIHCRQTGGGQYIDAGLVRGRRVVSPPR